MPPYTESYLTNTDTEVTPFLLSKYYASLPRNTDLMLFKMTYSAYQHVAYYQYSYSIIGIITAN